MKLAIVVGISLLTCIGTPVFSAEIYKWTNAAGEPVYSQSPPPAGITAELIETNVQSTETANKKSQNASGIDNAEAEHDQKPAEASMTNCEIARTNIAMLRLATPGAEFKGADGQPISYSQTELNANIKTNIDLAKSWCKD